MPKRHRVQKDGTGGHDEERAPSRGAPSSRLIRYGQGAALVFEFTGTIAAGVIIGYALDRYLGSEPLFLIVATLAAVAGGFVRLIQVVKRLEQRWR